MRFCTAIRPHHTLEPQAAPTHLPRCTGIRTEAPLSSSALTKHGVLSLYGDLGGCTKDRPYDLNLLMGRSSLWYARGVSTVASYKEHPRATVLVQSPNFLLWSLPRSNISRRAATLIEELPLSELPSNFLTPAIVARHCEVD